VSAARFSLQLLREQLWDRKLRRYAILIPVGLLVFIGLVVELWLIPRAAEQLEEELAGLGYHITYRDPDLVLWRGSLRLKDVTFHRSAEKDAPLVFSSDLGIQIDLSELIEKQLLHGKASIRHGHVIFYGDEGRHKFRDLSVRIAFDTHRAQIESFAGESSLGYQVDLTGSFRWGPASDVLPRGENTGKTETDTGKPAAPTDGGPTVADEFSESVGDLAWLDELAALLSCEPLGDELVNLQIELNWDGTKPNKKRSDGSEINSQLSLEGRLAGADVA
jgi:hypothetical protein